MNRVIPHPSSHDARQTGRERRDRVARPRNAAGYERRRDLPGLLPLWPQEISDDTTAGRWHLIGKLRRALREERRRGIAGDWTYDLARHAALHRAYRHELARHNQGLK